MEFSWRKDHKYYKLKLQKTLFGTTDLVCVWGSTTSHRGHYKIIPCDNQQQIDVAIEKITKRRKARGYIFCMLSSFS